MIIGPSCELICRCLNADKALKQTQLPVDTWPADDYGKQNHTEKLMLRIVSIILKRWISMEGQLNSQFHQMGLITLRNLNMGESIEFNYAYFIELRSLIILFLF